jgi:hypothetical protein
MPGSWHRSEVPSLHNLVEAILTYPSVLPTAQTGLSVATGHVFLSRSPFGLGGLAAWLLRDATPMM